MAEDTTNELAAAVSAAAAKAGLVLSHREIADELRRIADEIDNEGE